MRKIIIEKENVDTIDFSKVNESIPIFAKYDNVLCGMVINELPNGWILRVGGSKHCTGHHTYLYNCLSECSKHGYEFYIV